MNREESHFTGDESSLEAAAGAPHIYIFSSIAPRIMLLVLSFNLHWAGGSEICRTRRCNALEKGMNCIYICS
ncbi:hypothetical protein GDO81_009107 [Engystomops pustulosus]|uniref:Uncharacterized protein n=1 Tax=Engystomops pustulosus TaxID=76066 RepID=A0AAV7BNV3_ENGPU|nr:hypothetical protein GDO81_009107 [Engystomops pustulosus]